MTENRKKLVEVKNVSLTFNKGKANQVKAIDNVSFDIYEGEVFGLVGESGSGKTTIGRAILKLYNIDKGEIDFEGETISKLKGKSLFNFRKKAQMIFQDPQASLNSRMKVRDIIAEGLDVHKLVKNKADRDAKVQDLLDLVGLNKDHLTRYPHEFSGGQRQRIGIARALAVEPKFIIAHDLSMVKYISDRIGVMHWGKIVEIGTSDEVYHHPIHPYTQSLLSAVPEPDPVLERQRIHKVYDPVDELDGQEREMREIVPGHFVLATEEEAKAYKKK